jgi:hypothetical protein
MRCLTAWTLAALVIASSICFAASLPEALAAGLDGQIATMTNLVQHERISRYSQVGNKICKLDSFEALVNVIDGVEQYAQVRKKNKTFSHVSQIDGLWSFGETVTMLRTTRDALRGRVPVGDQVRYRYSGADRRWFVMLGSNMAGSNMAGSTTWWLSFEAVVQVSPRNGDIQRIAWTSDALPPETGIAQIAWTVEFQSLEIAGRRCTVPKTAIYRITRDGGRNRAEWNVTEFSEQSLYASESTIRFDQ